MNYNPIPREVWCPQCKEYTIRDDPNPTCKNSDCNERVLIRVVYSLITGEKLTGRNGKLAE
jgi:hypothetical protein